MKKLSNAEILARFEWLYQIKNKEIAPTPEQAKLLESTKAFCTLEVPERFESISYNSLKKYCSSLTLPFHLRGTNSNWENMLHLREDAYRSIIYLTIETESVDTEILLSEMSKHMHRQETAYFALFREIRALIESDPTLPELSRKRLTQVLSQSRSLYMTTFSNPARYEDPTSLRLIDGGKS